MRVLRVCLPNPGRVLVEEADVPSPGPGEVTVRVLRAGICGSDLHTYRHGHPWLPYPIRPGHEISGVIAEVGAGVANVAAGDMVLVNPVLNCGICRQCARGYTNLCDNLIGVGSHVPGGMAEALNIPARAAIRLPGGVSPLAASLIEPCATVARAVRRVASLDNKTVLVIGTSTLGLLTVGMVGAAGPKCMVATDLNPNKRGRAIKWGANSAIDGADGDITQRVLSRIQEKPDVVFDCVGSPATLALALDVVAKAGVIVVVGAEHGIGALPLEVVQDNEVTITGVAMYTEVDFASAISFVAGRVDLVSSLASAEFPVRRAEEAFHSAASGEEVKVQIVFDNPATRSPAGGH